MTTIDTNIPVPDEVKPKPKPRSRKASVAKKANPAASLLAALKFVAVSQKKAGPVGMQFCCFAHNWVASSDGVLTIGVQIEEDLLGCPHTLQFIDALSKISDDVAITQLGSNTLSVMSGGFRALVPCVDMEEVLIPPPDPQIASADDRIKAALDAVMGLATEGSPNATFASVLLQANTAVATNGHAMLEYWHGVDLPPNMMIPKASAVAIAKCTKTMTGFGYSQSSATFWFEDGSFIKTQLFGERYPNYAPVLDASGLNMWDVPDDFFKAVRAVESFAEEGTVYFGDGMVMASSDVDEASFYRIEGLPKEMAFNAKYLLLVEAAFKKAAFSNENSQPKVHFYSDSMRGAIMGIAFRETYKSEPSHIDGKGFDVMDDDIPF